MKFNLAFKKYGYALTATLLLVSVFVPLLRPAHAGASQLTSRSLTMSDSGASGGTIVSGVGSGTAVTYQFSFTKTANFDGVVIDFCANSPIIGDNCNSSVSGGMNLASFSTTGVTLVTAPNDAGQVAGWSSVTPATNRVTLAKGSGSQATSANQVFTLTGFTNPATRGTFYARVYTYTAANLASYTSPTSLGTFADYGGMAMSINQIITITAKVQETLSFCVTGLNPSQWSVKTCSDTTASTTAPALLLGHGTPTPTLDASQQDSGTVFSQLSTNATHGATIAMRNANNVVSGSANTPKCNNGGLTADFGDTCAIPGIGATPNLISPASGNAYFGMYMWNSEAADSSSVGVSSLAPTSIYHTSGHTTFTTTAGAALSTFTAAASAAAGTNNSGDIFPDQTNVYFGMDAATATGSGTPYANVLTTFGSVVASCPAPVFKVNNAYTFAAIAALTTPAGIYQANIDLIATGTF